MGNSKKAVVRHRLDPSIKGSLVSSCNLPPPSFTLQMRESLEINADGVELVDGIEVGCDLVGAFYVPGALLSN